MRIDIRRPGPHVKPLDMNKPLAASLFTGDVAKVYNTLMVPLFFEDFSRELAKRIQGLAPETILEVACGTGALTRALCDALPNTSVITATDLSGAMVAYAKSVGTARPVNWGQADVAALPHDDASFELVACQFGAMFFPDRVAAYREVRRVLRPGGTFLMSVWTSLEVNEFDAVASEALAGLYPESPIDFMARGPHGYASPDRIESDLRAAGFHTCRSDIVERVSTAVNAEQAALALCCGTPIRVEVEAREPGGLERATATVTNALRRRFGSGRIDGRMGAIVASAR